MRVRAPDVSIHAVEMLCRDEESIPLGVLEHHVLVLRAGVVGDGAHLYEARDAVVAVDHEVAGRELQDERLAGGGATRSSSRSTRRCGDRPASAPAEQRAPPLDGAEELGVRVHVDGAVLDGEALGQIRRRDHDRTRGQGRRRGVEIAGIDGVRAMLGGELLHAVLLARDDEHASLLLALVQGLANEGVEAADIAVHPSPPEVRHGRHARRGLAHQLEARVAIQCLEQRGDIDQPGRRTVR